MSGLLRNLIAVVIGLLRQGRHGVADTVFSHFWVTPLDAGLKVLKSDKYLQYDETAQFDYLLQIGQFFPVLRAGASFVNVAQQVQFLRPVPLFSRVRVATRVLYANEKCAYFGHRIYAKDALAAEVLVKMKFKQGRATLAPATFLACSFTEMPAQVQRWEVALQTPSTAPLCFLQR
ncbi:thioesterase family protein [Pseudomonas sp. GV071]|jgi:acyl-CoA thioesterase FadM|uniref:acyl-CoA thioesterase n=1 Tax=Pseudomonas sp. GV071 TaxID=2135754 RepID=UPI000D3BEA89|nr:thioesterase family protein [Pseudomonas sp. GV071]PTQ70042.1 acyl-CoA thioesterase FadM [Pseudomonas sp. GV071]